MATLIQTGQVKTNDIGLAYAQQTALGTLPTTGWKLTEPNAINGFGATITTVARTPISQTRGRRKGSVVDLDSAADFDADTTLESVRDFADGFLFVEPINGDVTELAATGAETTTDTYTGLTALTAAQAAKFAVDSLLWVRGGTNAANNGLKVIGTAATSTDTSLNVADNLADETASFVISFAGHRIAALDTVTWDWDPANNQATLTSAGIVAALQALGLIAGARVHIGSVAAAGGAIQNAFQNLAANDMFGYARVLSFSGADNVVFDKVDAALQFDDATDPTTAVDIVFGEFMRDVPVSSAEFCENAYSFEASFPGLGDGTPGNSDDAYQYSLDNFCNTMAFNLPLTDKSTVGFGFIGTDTQNPTTTRQAGAASAASPTRTAAFNTSADIARLRIDDADLDGLTTDFKSLTFTINNNVSPEKVLGRRGARFLNTGTFEINIEAQLLFTNPLVINRIRDNATVTMDFILKNDDGVIAVDVPSMTLGGGDREFPVNESVLINTTAEAFGDTRFGNASVLLSVFPIPLP